MQYEKPETVEIKMDAEVGSYQNDFDPTRDPSFAAPSRSVDTVEGRDSEG